MSNGQFITVHSFFVTIFLFLVCPWASGAYLDGFRIGPLPESIPEGMPIPLEITALDETGASLPEYEGTPRLVAYKYGKPSLVISEIDHFNAIIEVINTSEDPVDISSWEFQAVSVPTTLTWYYRFPQNTVIPPKGVFLLSEKEYSNPHAPVYILEHKTPGDTFQVVQLLNNSGQVIDQVMLNANLDNREKRWLGAPFFIVPNEVVYSRRGTENHFSTMDWRPATPSLGLPNPDLLLPWVGEKSTLHISHEPMVFASGRWSGSIELKETADLVSLRVDDGVGNSGVAGPVRIIPKPPLSLNYSAIVLNPSENSPGVAGTAIVVLPEKARSPTTIHLRSSNPDEFEVPAILEIPAGELSGSFDIVNLNDSMADGLTITSISASADGYSTVSITLLNEDNEQGTVFVHLSGSGDEGWGFSPYIGYVYCGPPAAKDMVVRLQAESPLQIPNEVTIKKGETLAKFPIRVTEDSIYSGSQYGAKVTVSMPNWISGETFFSIRENDPGSFELIYPSKVVENKPDSITIRLESAYNKDLVLKVVGDLAYFQLPSEVIIPAGTTEYVIPITLPNNNTKDEYPNITIGFQDRRTNLERKASIKLVDDEVNVNEVFIGFSGDLQFSGAPKKVQAYLGDRHPIFGRLVIQEINTTAELRLKDPLGRIIIPPQTITFTNGVWEGFITLEGLGTGLQYEVEWNTIKGLSRPFVLVASSTIDITVDQLAWHEPSRSLLVLEKSPENRPGRFLSIDPDTASIKNTVNLPKKGTKFSVSPEGAFVWIASDFGTIQKIDLNSWQHAGEFAVDTDPTYKVTSLLALPGQENSVVAAVGPASDDNPAQWFIRLFANGQVVKSVQMPVGFHPFAEFIQQGKQDKFLLQSGLNLLSMSVPDLKIQKQGQVIGKIEYKAGRLYSNTGGIYDAETLSEVLVHTALPVGYTIFHYADPKAQRVFYTFNGSISIYDSTSSNKVAQFSLGGLPAVDVIGFTGWEGVSHPGLVVVSPQTIFFLKVPYYSEDRVDLALSYKGISHQQVSGVDTYSLEVEVSNLGLTPAFDVYIEDLKNEPYLVGNLVPGERRTISINRGIYEPGLERWPIFVYSPLSDENPANNVLEIRDERKSFPFPGFSELILGSIQLFPSPDKSVLYVTLSPSAGAVSGGIAVIDPAQGSIKEIFSLTGDPKKVAITEDGQYVYYISHLREVRRLNLSAKTDYLLFSLDNEELLDLASVPGKPDWVIVASNKKVFMLKNGEVASSSFEVEANPRGVGFSNDLLWSAQPGVLNSFSVSDLGLEQKGSIQPFTSRSGIYKFSVDNDRLFFVGTLADTKTAMVHDLSFYSQTYSIPEKNILLGSVGDQLFSLDSMTLQSLKSEKVFRAFGDIRDIAHWGEAGVAVTTTTQQLLMFESSLITGPEIADLQVSIEPPVNPLPYEMLTWKVTVSNPSSENSPRSVLKISTSDVQELSFQGKNPDLANRWSGYFNLGTIPANSSIEILVSGKTFKRAEVIADLTTGSIDPNLANNSSSSKITAYLPSTDISFGSVHAPESVAVGQEFDVTYEIANLGENAAFSAFIRFFHQEGFQIISALPHQLDPYGQVTSSNVLPPGEKETFTIKLKANEPGIIAISVFTNGQITDTENSNNQNEIYIYASGNQTPKVLPPKTPLIWNETAQELVAIMGEFVLYGLDPITFEPRWNIPLSTVIKYSSEITQNKFLWLAGNYGPFFRIDLESRKIDREFSYPFAGFVRSIASHPANPDLLLVSLYESISPGPVARLFDNGVARADAVPGEGVFAFDTSGKPFLVNPDNFILMEITSNGLIQKDNYRHLWGNGVAVLPQIGNTLSQTGGKIVDLDLLTTRDIPHTKIHASDPVTRRYYNLSDFQFPNGQIGTRATMYNADTLAAEREEFLPVSLKNNLKAVALGQYGLLLYDLRAHLITFPTAPPQPDLELKAATSKSVPGVGISFPLSIYLTNKSNAFAKNIQMTVSLPDGLASVNHSPETRDVRFFIDSLLWDTNISLNLIASTPGAKTIGVQVSNEFPDPILQNNAQNLTVHIEDKPSFLPADNIIEEDIGIVGILSKPAARDFKVRFNVTPITTDVKDFVALNGELFFSAGASVVTFRDFLLVDDKSEADKTFLINFESDDVHIVNKTVIMTLVDYDLPLISVPNVKVAEGNSGDNPAMVTVNLSEPTPFPIEIGFETEPDTAEALNDYIPKSGTIYFLPNETSKTIFFPRVIGDSQPERDERINLMLYPLSPTARLQSGKAQVIIQNDDLVEMKVVYLSPTQLQIQFPDVPGLQVQVQARIIDVATGNWLNMNLPVQVENGVGKINLKIGAYSRIFYRLVVR